MVPSNEGGAHIPYFDIMSEMFACLCVAEIFAEVNMLTK